jgi:hypothetical protein
MAGAAVAGAIGGIVIFLMGFAARLGAVEARLKDHDARFKRLESMVASVSRIESTLGWMSRFVLGERPANSARQMRRKSRDEGRDSPGLLN